MAMIHLVCEKVMKVMSKQIMSNWACGSRAHKNIRSWTCQLVDEGSDRHTNRCCGERLQKWTVLQKTGSRV